MGRHSTKTRFEREVLAENEDERTALAHLRQQAHMRAACPICRLETQQEREAWGRGYDTGLKHGALGL